MKRMVMGFYYSGDHVLLIQKKRAKLPWMVDTINGIGGHIDGLEIPLETMEREFREETGCGIRINWESTIRLFGDPHPDRVSDDSWEVYCFRAFGPMITDHKTDEGATFWHKVDRLPSEIVPNLNWLIPLHADQDFGILDRIEAL